MYGFTNIPKLLSYALPVVALSCSTPKQYHLNILQGNSTEKVDFSAKIEDNYSSGSPYSISNIAIDGNTLYLDFQYKMSCSGKDDIEFIGLPLDLSHNPPRRNVRLIIHSFDSNCQQLVNHTVVVNISELSSSKDFKNEVDLFIDGWRLRPMKYIYVTPYSAKL